MPDGAASVLAISSAPARTVVSLGRAYPDVLAVGAFLKNTVCAVRGDRAVLSGVNGDLGTVEAIAAFETAVESLLGATGVRPRAVAHDLHPDFHSTRFASGLGVPTVAVQHHHAHVAALAAEHGIEGPLIGLALDGFGLGPGNQSWGGELILDEGATYRRLGHLALLPQPGGDAAARAPWRMAAAALHRLGRASEIASRFAHHRGAAQIAAMLDRRVNAPETSSCGRLFDAACGFLGVRPVAEFEGQAPMELERLVRRPAVWSGGWSVGEDGVLDFLPLLDRLSSMAPAEGADLLHGTLIEGLSVWAATTAERFGVRVVALGGGCFLNRVLREGIANALRARGLVPLIAAVVPPGDQGLSLGQARVAALAVEAGLARGG